MGDEEAIIFCDKALEIDQNLVEAWNKILMDAIECYDKTLEIDPNYTLAQNNKAIVLNHLNKQNS